MLQLADERRIAQSKKLQTFWKKNEPEKPPAHDPEPVEELAALEEELRKEEEAVKRRCEALQSILRPRQNKHPHHPSCCERPYYSTLGASGDLSHAHTKTAN